MPPRNLLTEWARLLIESLVRAKIEVAVISPGSRSTPFTVAALRAAGLTCHAVVDERSAAFFALGWAKVTGRPTLLICTSGTAAAHYLPAVIEAAYSQVPLIVLTADRPHELLDCGAPQTIDQGHLFGRHVRWFADLGAPDAASRSLAALHRKAFQAALSSQHPVCGPVHLNAHAAKPLEPVFLDGLEDPTADEIELSHDVTALLDAPMDVHRPQAKASSKAISTLLQRLMTCRRGLIVAGRRELWQHRMSSCPDAPLRLAEAVGWPLLVESPSQLRLSSLSGAPPVIDAVESVLRLVWPTATGAVPTGDELPLPDFVLELGPPITSGGWARVAERLPRGVRHVVHDVPWPDPHNNLGQLILSDPWETANQLVGQLLEPSGQGSGHLPTVNGAGTFTQALQEANRACWRAVNTALEELARDPSPALSEPVAIRALVTALPQGSLLALGNSLAIREVDWVCPRGSADVEVWVQRGANGIDGLIAGATGAAYASRRPTCLLLGDVSALHDLGSLAIARTAPVPLLIAVIDNGGGRIFDLLSFDEQAEKAVGRFWSTPPEIDFEAAARTFGLGYRACRTASDIQSSVSKMLAPDAEPRASLLHLKVEGESAERFSRSLPEPSLRRLRS